MVTNTIKLVNGYPDYIGWWCLGGEAPILVNDQSSIIYFGRGFDSHRLH